jgi:hypothetical protein
MLDNVLLVALVLGGLVTLVLGILFAYWESAGKGKKFWLGVALAIIGFAGTGITIWQSIRALKDDKEAASKIQFLQEKLANRAESITPDQRMQIIRQFTPVVDGRYVKLLIEKNDVETAQFGRFMAILLIEANCGVLEIGKFDETSKYSREIRVFADDLGLATNVANIFQTNGIRDVFILKNRIETDTTNGDIVILISRRVL